MSRLAQEVSRKHRLYSLMGQELRKAEAKHLVPVPVQLFLGRFFVGLQGKYSLLEVDEMAIGDNTLPGYLPVQGSLVPCTVKGKDEHGSSVEVRGVLLIVFSSIAVMPAQLSDIDDISEVVVNFLPNGTAVCSFYDSITDSLVIDIIG